MRFTRNKTAVFIFFRAVVVTTHRQHQGGFVKGNIFVLTLIHMPFSTLIALRQKKYSSLMDGKKIMLRSSRICFNSIACNHHYSLGVCLFSQQPLAKKWNNCRKIHHCIWLRGYTSFQMWNLQRSGCGSASILRKMAPKFQSWLLVVHKNIQQLTYGCSVRSLSQLLLLFASWLAITNLLSAIGLQSRVAW